MLSNLKRILRDRLAERRHFRGSRDWALDLYNRVVYRLRRYPLPLRDRPCRIGLRGRDRPFYIRPGTSDFSVLKEVFIDLAYDAGVPDDLGRVRVVIDLGANVGFSVRRWLERFPEATVVAVEPDAANIAVAKLNNADGPDAARVKWVQACAAGSARTVYLDRRDDAWAFAMTDAPVGTGGEPIPAIPIPDLIAAAGNGPADQTVVDLFKCDIEGAEAELFADCKSWIGRVRYFIVEVHTPYLVANFTADLEKAGADFDVKVLSDDGSHQVVLGRNRAMAS